MNKSLGKFGSACVVLLLLMAGLTPLQAAKQRPVAAGPQNPLLFHAASTQDYNQRLENLSRSRASTSGTSSAADYRIGAEDLIEISVYGAPDLDRTVRVSADGWISVPLAGDIEAMGSTTRELAAEVEKRLRRNYMTDPHVNVFLREVQSHPISVFGAVEKPGVFQVRGAKSLIEVLSIAQGLADDAGDSVIIMRHGGVTSSAATGSPDPQPVTATDLPRESAKQGPSEKSAGATRGAGFIEVNLKDLFGSRDARYNVTVYPGDVVKVPRAGIVPVMETNIQEAVKNNVFGLINLLEAAGEAGCAAFVLISSDKAVNPTSVMGATKRVGELILSCRPSRGMRCVSVRFGNVLGSSGSVVPLFQEQLRNNQELTITHPQIRRFFMTSNEAVSLVLQAFAVGDHGHVLVLDMNRSVRIVDLARSLIRLSGKCPDEVKIRFTGLRPGEKIFEELFYATEEVAPTACPKVRRARGPMAGWEQLEGMLDELQTAVALGRVAAIRAKLKEIVPQYSYRAPIPMLPLTRTQPASSQTTARTAWSR